ncbi:hypothetical protein SKAU_G00412670 [Synaphobranchus kaupii]|uniref:Uncharacterized protein n=1 Tax=Synaphobranchus kaupii TaxID=118154 RepID=A0A9Q1E822_SYNKA|nr:hypothetical protein SKAU_G00412670 [Synaphobranchus kaupii]
MTQKDNPPMRKIRHMAQAAWKRFVRLGERKDEDPKVFAIQGSSNVPLELEGSETPAQRSPAPRASQDHPSRRNNGAKGGRTPLWSHSFYIGADILVRLGAQLDMINEVVWSQANIGRNKLTAQPEQMCSGQTVPLACQVASEFDVVISRRTTRSRSDS